MIVYEFKPNNMDSSLEDAVIQSSGTLDEWIDQVVLSDKNVWGYINIIDPSPFKGNPMIEYKSGITDKHALSPYLDLVVTDVTRGYCRYGYVDWTFKVKQKRR